jgi:hypothetical protein
MLVVNSEVEERNVCEAVDSTPPRFLGHNGGYSMQTQPWKKTVTMLQKLTIIMPVVSI